MIASVLQLSRLDCKALGVRDAYGIHKAVYSLFPQQTEQTRDFLYADKGGDFKMRQIESKRIPDSFLEHAEYGFNVLLNPTKRDKATGKIIPIKGDLDSGITTEQALHRWFISKAPHWGFEVNPQSLQINEIGVQTFKKGEHELVHGYAHFLGQFKVIQHDKFKHAFQNGIGRAKSFGFGLLQIVPLHS